MSKKALLLITEGAEEMEAVIVADVLRRAEIEVTIAGLNTKDPVKMSRGVMIVPDKNLDDVDANTYDILILPGGLQAANTFCESAQVGQLLKLFEKSNKLIGVICASPIALEAHSIAKGRRITCHPTQINKLEENYKYCKDRVVTDGNLITSQGPGTAFHFALTIIANQIGYREADIISGPLIL